VVCVTGFDGFLWVSFSWLAEVDDGAFAVEDGPCTFTQVRGLLGYMRCSDDSQVKGRVDAPRKASYKSLDVEQPRTLNHCLLHLK
jgi:hypothetical protein